MKLIIRDTAEDVVDWAAKYVIKRIKVTTFLFWVSPLPIYGKSSKFYIVLPLCKFIR
jgi:hypothetical protein